MTGGGFQADGDGMAAQASALSRAGADLEQAGSPLRRLPDGSENVFGGHGAGPAAENLRNSWARELDICVSALHELAEKVRISAQNYRTTDGRIGANFGGGSHPPGESRTPAADPGAPIGPHGRIRDVFTN